MGDTKEYISERHIKAYLEFAAKLAEDEIPESGKFDKFAVRFQADEAGNHALIWIQCDERDRDARRLMVSAMREYDDRLWSQTVFVGSTAEVLAKLRNPETIDEVTQSIIELLAKVDES